MFAPLAGWAETVHGLRDYVATLGWAKSDDHNYALALHPAGRIAIAVATGNEQTGMASGTPATKASKGPSTLEAVLINQAQFDLFPDLKAAVAQPQREEDMRATWILLIHRAAGETRVELSLPVAIAADGRVTDWRGRIIL